MTTTSDIALVVFDMAGTTVHDEGYVSAAFREALAAAGDREPRLVVEHVTRMHDDLAPDWPRSEGGYEVIVEGVPRMVCRLDMEDEHGDHAVGGVLLTATRIVNAIPAVVAAEPRPLTTLDLPLITAPQRNRGDVP